MEKPDSVDQITSRLDDTRLESFNPSLNSTPSTQTFTKFIDFPTEIRRHIWSLAIPKSRVIRTTISIDEVRTHISGPFSKVPTILHICRESREVGLGIFKIGFGSIPSQLGSFYWNPNIDTIYLDPTDESMDGSFEESAIDYEDFEVCFANYNIHKQLASVQTLAICLDRYLLAHIGDMLEWLQGFPNLESLSLLINPRGNIYTKGAAVLYEPLNIPVRKFPGPDYERLPLTIEERIENRMDSFPKLYNVRVEVCVLGFRKPKKSSFCIGSPTPW
ncbi:hypothetical protein B7494_g4353 [Chlorociboria aeruginascens]|nr:hypothetical protein B7494_g4353 [Chlorociboria aeruginascens]